MTSVLKRSLSFLVNFLVSAIPVLIISPLLLYYLFSDSEANRVAGLFALLNTALLIPFFYLFFSLIFSTSKSPGERVARIELSDKSFFIVLKRVAPFVFLFYALFFLQLQLVIVAIFFIYILVVLFSKDNRSLADIFSKTHYLFPVK